MWGNLDSGSWEIFAYGIWNLGKFCLRNSESWSLESGIQLKESGIPLMINTQNLIVPPTKT